MRFTNFHTHRELNAENEVGCISLNYDELHRISSGTHYTVGIHPWHTRRMPADAPKAIRTAAQNKNIIGIGEIGLDRLQGAPLEQQIELLKIQADFALELNKPIVIHCVRAWSELIGLLNTDRYRRLKKAVHGFRGKANLARQLIENNFYLSFGAILVNPTPELSESLTLVPRNRLFLETDTSEMPIAEIYDAAADILDTTSTRLKEQLSANLADFFGFLQ